MKILNSDQMRNIDRRATERFGIPSIVLMENAALAVVDAIEQHYGQADNVAILCGTGQNGGDGFAVARHLENRGVVPTALVVGDRSRISGDARTNLEICERLGLPIFDIATIEQVDDALARIANADLIVDAIFGTGLNRAPAGVQAEVIRAIAEFRIPVVAIDLPSGANASSTVPFDPCIHAELTVTFAAPKVCHVFEPSASWCGEVIVADISIPEIAMDEEPVSLALTTPSDVTPLFSVRAAAAHKGTYGHVAIVGGSPGRSGAAVLAARGAIRSGAGLVTVLTDEATAPLVHAHSIESMTYSGTDVLSFLAGKDAVLIGPGLGDDQSSYQSVRSLLAMMVLPTCVDASALNAYEGQPEALNPDRHPRVITPHPGELARLTGTTAAAINADRLSAARGAARLTGCVVVLKGHQTLIASPDGQVNVNPTGNPGMASGGMGDVLGGIVATLLGQGVDPFDAACAAVYLHGFAGDTLKEEMGDIGLTANDLAERLPLAIQKLRRSRVPHDS